MSRGVGMAVKKRKSIIFTNKELNILYVLAEGIKYVDYDGQFNHRIKPKVEELLFWCNKKRVLKKVLKGGVKRDSYCKVRKKTSEKVGKSSVC